MFLKLEFENEMLTQHPATGIIPSASALAARFAGAVVCNPASPHIGEGHVLSIIEGCKNPAVSVVK